MKRKLSIILCIMMMFTMILSFTGCSSLDNDYVRITDMDYKAIVVDEPDSQGKIVVTERITFDVHAASRDNLFWELWRDLCEDYIDGVKVHYKVNSVKQILPDGTKITWEESPKLYWDDSDYESWNTKYGPGKWYHSPGPYNESMRRYECVFFYVDGLYREEVTFEIEYEMYNAVLRYGDCSDLYIAMYSGDTIKHLESFNGEILIPNKDMPKEGNYKVTTYGTNAGKFPVEESATKNPGYHTFSFNLTEDELNFKPYNEYIEFDLVSYGEDKHIFSEYASKNHYYNDDVLDEIWEEQEYYQNAPQRYKELKTKILLVCIGIALLILFIGIRKIAKLKKKYPFYTTDETNETFRDIPSDLDPKFVNALVFCKDKKATEDDAGVYSSILLSLARKKYIDIEETSYGTVWIGINEEPEEEEEIKEVPQMDESDDILGDDQTDIYKQHSYRTYEPIQDETVYKYSNIDNNQDNEQEEQNDERDYIPKDIVPMEEREPLTVCEEHYLNLIKHHKKYGRISMNTLQSRIESDYDYTKSFSKNIQKSVVDIGVGSGYFQKANWQEPKKDLTSFANRCWIFGILFMLVNLIIRNTQLDLAFGGFIILGIVCITIGMYLKSKAHKYVLLTEYGEIEYRKWRGLYNFLKSDTLINERTVIELPLWEKYLVYATAFGISEKVIEAIKIHCPEIVETNSIVYNSYCRSGRIRHTGRHFHSSVRTGSFGGSYGGGGGGFGYGGGGRGGGGGGGGH